jgi:isoleucyl-tRNA synthetase
MSTGKDKNAYKDTLNLPTTGFDMRAGLIQKEPAIQARWKQQDLYGRIRKARDGAEPFILHDGPPYANGNIHMGTALNKVLKDIVVRVKNMTGLDAPYVPGWDCHGLPIEDKVVKELGPAARDLSPVDIRQRCHAYADRFAKLQSEQFRRLGVIGEFDNPYITMDPWYESAVLEVFADLIEQDLVYRQLKPVHWSIENRTALADAELIYHDRDDTSVYVAFKLTGGHLGALPKADGATPGLLVWTTTPWTLPANLAVAVHPDYTYAAVRAATARGDWLLVVAERLVEKVAAAIGAARPGFLQGFKVVGTCKGRDLLDAGLTYAHPLLDGKCCPVVPAGYVTLEDGTGLVHTAPGHGAEDYGTALKCGLEIYCPVRDDGTFDDTAPEFLRGKDVWQANPMVIERLDQAGTLMLRQTIRHSYPHDWRSKTPTIFRATKQWFIAVDRPLRGMTKSLRDLAMECCRRGPDDGGVEFIPAWGRNRIAGMLDSRPDWCISRQRVWGLPIPAMFNEAHLPLMTPGSVRAIAATIARLGSDAWFTASPAELLGDYDPAEDPAVEDPESFQPDKLRCGKDIFDVWFESGSSWYAVAMKRGLVETIPVDLYLEGSDQHRGWFQLSLLPALGARGGAPFRTVLTHGFVVDEAGYKMSKSDGNTIDVIDQLDKRGADILRLWVASQDYQDDIRCGENLIAKTEDAYRKIRNTLRFCMGACSDFDPARHSVEPTEHSVDRWMLMTIHQLIRDVREAYDTYEFHKAARRMYEFCTVEASSIYLSAVKDRLYCESPDAIRRRASQSVIHLMLCTLVKLLAPILPHTCEEAWGHIPARPADWPDSVHLALLPEFDEQILALAEDIRPVQADQGNWVLDELRAGPAWLWDKLMGLRDAGLVKLEALRNAGVKNPLDAEAVLKVRAGDEAARQVIETYRPELEDLLGVGYARVESAEDLPDGAAVAIEVLDSRGRYLRCARSWKRRPDVGSNQKYPDLSARDAAVMEELGMEKQ